MADPRKECPPEWQEDTSPDDRRSAETADNDDWS